MTNREFSLIARASRGELNFHRLVEVLSTRGYVTDLEREPGLSFHRPSMNQASQDDFNFLFREFFPTEENNIDLRVYATDEGGVKGSFSYAIFNAAIVDPSEIRKKLIEENSARDFD